VSADIHAHLDFKDFDNDLDQVIRNAETAGVRLILSCGTDLESSARALSIAEKHGCVFAAAGVHPHEAGKAAPDYLDAVSALLAHPRVKAVGEIGLDYHYDFAPRDIQEKVFSELLDLAAKKGKPVMIHSRLAEEKAFEMTAAAGLEKALFHCFTGSLETARRIQARGYYIGVTGIATFNNPSNAELVRQLDPERLITETDCPFLAPKPFRGKRCEPAHIAIILEKLASLFPDKDMKGITERNAKTLLGL
jgi:TatD DNase family protein